VYSPPTRAPARIGQAGTPPAHQPLISQIEMPGPPRAIRAQEVRLSSTAIVPIVETTSSSSGLPLTRTRTVVSRAKAVKGKRRKPRSEATRAGSLRTPQLFPRERLALRLVGTKGRRSLLRCRHLKCRIECDDCLLDPRLIDPVLSAMPRRPWRGLTTSVGALKSPACVCLRLLSLAFLRPMIAPPAI